MLDRDGDYWTMLPNRERYRHRLGDVARDAKAVTFFGKDDDVEALFDFPDLEELTFHEPKKEHLAVLGKLTGIQRLRVSHARPRDLTFLEPLTNVEQLVLEYVSGFDSLAPLRSLPRLRALHLENLRRVSDFSGLEGIESLRYLCIDGTLDWKQPVSDFEFCRGLPNLEVLTLWGIINKTPFPATLPLLSLRGLQKLKMGWNALSVEEYALLEVGLADVEGADWGPYRKFSRAGSGEWFEFTGKGSGAAKCSSKNAAARCAEFSEKYEQLKQEARRVIDASR